MKGYEKQYIDGAWRVGRGKEMSNYNPYTGELLYTYRAASQEDVDDAYQAAKKAQRAWANTTPQEKQVALKALIPAFESLKDDMTAASLEEGGKNIRMAENEAFACMHTVEKCLPYTTMLSGRIMNSNMPGRENYVYRMPKGVIGVIAPWNVPFGLAMRSTMPALACGNAVVLKPSSDTPASAFLIAEAFHKAGFPKGLFNAVAGSGSEIGDYFVRHPIPALISFTGSSPVGGRVAELAGAAYKEVSLEMGGNNVMIVLEDADIDRAAREAIFGKFSNNGQVCMAINRFIVMDKVHDRFVEALTARVRALKAGDPKDPNNFIGPLINSAQVRNVERLIQETVDVGATVALKGKIEGNVIHPWILTNVTNDMPTAANEIFGPVASVIRARSEREAIDIANDTEYGLSGCLWTRDVYHGIQLAKQLQTGCIHINNHSISAEEHVMFGGEKASGKGRTGGEWFVKSFTSERLISAYLPSV
jgi:aldehyde dehydrogenase (NAD+)